MNAYKDVRVRRTESRSPLSRPPPATYTGGMIDASPFASVSPALGAVVHETGLIATIAAGLGVALIFGYATKRIGLSPILGYLLAGIIVGPHTPGIVADSGLAQQLAEIGVILLMFGVGMHFSLADLMRVKAIAIPGAVAQSGIATLLGIAVAQLWGWSLGAGVVLGVALSVASTVVLIRGLQDHHLLETSHGHAAIGWLIVEDLFTVLVLVLLPALSGVLGGSDNGAAGNLWGTLAWTVGKVVLLATIVLTVGSRVVPWLLVKVARVESRELFTLSVLAIALGIAYGSAIAFDVSMALGAFLAGMVVAQSDMSHRAAADALPLGDAFAVLFFVSVGMLFDPAFLIEEPGLVLATLGIVMIAKPLTALVIALALGYPIRTGVTAAAGLAQIGEFSFILAHLGNSLDLFPTKGYSVVLACAILSIAVNPFLFRTSGRLENLLRSWPWLTSYLARRNRAPTEPVEDAHALKGHAILCGHGRVGSILAEVLEERGWTYVVIDQQRATVERLQRRGVTAYTGDAGNTLLLEHAGIDHARLLLVAVQDPVATALIVAHAARINPKLPIVVRVESDGEARPLRHLGDVMPVIGTQEAAFQMVRHLVQGFGLGPLESEATVFGLRHRYGYETTDVRTRFVELTVGERGAAGKKVVDLGLPRDVLIVALRRGGEYLVPRGTTELHAGDGVLALLAKEHAAAAEAILVGPVPSPTAVDS